MWLRRGGVAMARARARARPARGRARARGAAFGAGVVELAEPDCDVTADDDRTAPGLDDDDLPAAGVARRRDPAAARVAARARRRPGRTARRCLDPLADGVVVLVRASWSSCRWTWIGLPAKRWLPPQWSKCRWVLTTRAPMRGPRRLASPPGAQERLLDQVFSLLERPQQPATVHIEPLAAVRLDPGTEGLPVERSGVSTVRVHAECDGRQP